MTDNRFENNIVYAGPRCLFSASKSGSVAQGTPTVTLDYNLYFCDSAANPGTWGWFPLSLSGFDKYAQATGNDRHSRFADPHFAGSSTNDFHLGSDSPAVSAGTAADLPLGEQDLEGMPRVKGGKVDIGCYEKR